MARIHGILAAVLIGSAATALPAGAQSFGSASLTHTVNVTVPARVKVRVSSLSIAAPALANQSATPVSAEGLTLTVSASQPWVLAAGRRTGISSQKAQLQWSAEGVSRFSVLPSTLSGAPRGEPVVLTLTAP